MSKNTSKKGKANTPTFTYKFINKTPLNRNTRLGIVLLTLYNCHWSNYMTSINICFLYFPSCKQR